MPAIKSKDLQIYNAKQFKNSVSGVNAANVYFTFGRCYSWPNDITPPAANTSTDSIYDIWNNMIGGKRLSGNNVRHVIPRRNWTPGTEYAFYDNTMDSLDVLDYPFYVVTDEWNVYKCLGNNYGGLSTSKPTSISSLSDFQTEDKYIWKYMYTITAEEQLRFVTEDYIPVKTIETNDQSLQWQVQRNVINGGIHNILVTDPGSGYTSNDVSVLITGDGQDANAFAVLNVMTNAVESIVVNNKGINYTHATVELKSSVGSGAKARAIISPIGGHGSDPLSELGGSNIMINLTLKNTETDKYPINNEFRQICLLENPRVYRSTKIMSNTFISQITKVELNSISSEYNVDEFVYQGANLASATFTGRVVDWDSSNNVIRLSNVIGESRAELLIGESSGAARFLSLVTQPDLEPYSGKVLYIDNIVPIERADDQAEDFKIVLNF